MMQRPLPLRLAGMENRCQQSLDYNQSSVMKEHAFGTLGLSVLNSLNMESRVQLVLEMLECGTLWGQLRSMPCPDIWVVSQEHQCELSRNNERLHPQSRSQPSQRDSEGTGYPRKNVHLVQTNLVCFRFRIQFPTLLCPSVTQTLIYHLQGRLGT